MSDQPTCPRCSGYTAPHCVAGGGCPWRQCVRCRIYGVDGTTKWAERPLPRELNDGDRHPPGTED